ncbi:MAG TPA: rRNA maturation RNase YbeY [Chthoniobacterales bacterium]
MNATTPKISVRNLQRRIAVNVADLEKFARKAAKLCLGLPSEKPSDLERLPDVAVLIVSDRQIAALHKRFMHETGPTDVITFQHGEIFISGETAKRNAQRFENQLENELRLYIVHGLLHLHGFDDRDPENAKKMVDVQRKILAKSKL